MVWSSRIIKLFHFLADINEYQDLISSFAILCGVGRLRPVRYIQKRRQAPGPTPLLIHYIYTESPQTVSPVPPCIQIHPHASRIPAGYSFRFPATPSASSRYKQETYPSPSALSPRSPSRPCPRSHTPHPRRLPPQCPASEHSSSPSHPWQS